MRHGCRGELSCGVPVPIRPDFVSKIGVVLEEADESVFWLELLVDSGLVRQEKIGDLLNEANQLVAIFAASRKTALERRAG